MADVTVAGAGVAGTAIALALSERGVDVAVVAPSTTPERSFTCAGQLHSGLRYVETDPIAARACAAAFMANEQRFADWLSPHPTLAVCSDDATAERLLRAADTLGLSAPRAPESLFRGLGLKAGTMPYAVPDRQVRVADLLTDGAAELGCRGVERREGRLERRGDTLFECSATDERQVQPRVLVDTSGCLRGPQLDRSGRVFGSMLSLDEVVYPGILIAWSAAGRSDLDTVAVMDGTAFVGSTWSSVAEPCRADRERARARLAELFERPPGVRAEGHRTAHRVIGDDGRWGQPFRETHPCGPTAILSVEIAKMTHCFSVADQVADEVCSLA